MNVDVIKYCYSIRYDLLYRLIYVTENRGSYKGITVARSFQLGCTLRNLAHVMRSTFFQISLGFFLKFRIH